MSYLCYKLQAPSRQQDHQGLAVRGGQQCQAHRLHIAGHCCQPQAAATVKHQDLRQNIISFPCIFKRAIHKPIAKL